MDEVLKLADDLVEWSAKQTELYAKVGTRMGDAP